MTRKGHSSDRANVELEYLTAVPLWETSISFLIVRLLGGRCSMEISQYKRGVGCWRKQPGYSGLNPKIEEVKKYTCRLEGLDARSIALQSLGPSTVVVSRVSAFPYYIPYLDDYQMYSEVNKHSSCRSGIVGFLDSINSRGVPCINDGCRVKGYLNSDFNWSPAR